MPSGILGVCRLARPTAFGKTKPERMVIRTKTKAIRENDALERTVSRNTISAIQRWYCPVRSCSHPRRRCLDDAVHKAAPNALAQTRHAAARQQSPCMAAPPQAAPPCGRTPPLGNRPSLHRGNFMPPLMQRARLGVNALLAAACGGAAMQGDCWRAAACRV